MLQQRRGVWALPNAGVGYRLDCLWWTRQRSTLNTDAGSEIWNHNASDCCHWWMQPMLTWGTVGDSRAHLRWDSAKGRCCCLELEDLAQLLGRCKSTPGKIRCQLRLRDGQRSICNAVAKSALPAKLSRSGLRHFSTISMKRLNLYEADRRAKKKNWRKRVRGDSIERPQRRRRGNCCGCRLLSAAQLLTQDGCPPSETPGLKLCMSIRAPLRSVNSISSLKGGHPPKPSFVKPKHLWQPTWTNRTLSVAPDLASALRLSKVHSVQRS